MSVNHSAEKILTFSGDLYGLVIVVPLTNQPSNVSLRYRCDLLRGNDISAIK